MKLIVIGIQGSGKSTQGNLLSKDLKLPYLSTGHIFRVLSHEHTSLGRYIKELLHAGYLVPDSQTMKIVTDYLARPEYEEGYILDGFPRTLNQAEKFKEDITRVLYLKVSDKEALWRLSYRTGSEADGRDDETLVAVRKRIELFHKHTQPVLDFYRKHHKLIEIDGEQPIEKIHEEILHRLKEK